MNQFDTFITINTVKFIAGAISNTVLNAGMFIASVWSFAEGRHFLSAIVLFVAFALLFSTYGSWRKVKDQIHGTGFDPIKLSQKIPRLEKVT